MLVVTHMFQYVLIDLLVESIIQQETGMMTPIGKLIFMMGVAQLRIGRGKFTGFTSTVYFDGKQLMVEKKQNPHLSMDEGEPL